MSEMQTIQWFPGHMTKTKRQIQSSLKLVDVVAEIIDARIPVSSRNPDLAKLVQNKPRVILLNKCDMANQTATKLWIDYFKKQNLVAIPVDCKSGRGLDKFAPAVNTVMSKRIAKLKEKGTECYYFPSFEEIEKFLLKNCINGDLLITMGAGDIVNVGEHLLGR